MSVPCCSRRPRRSSWTQDLKIAATLVGPAPHITPNMALTFAAPCLIALRTHAASVLPDSVRRLLPPRVAQRLRRCAVDARCKFARLNAFRSQTRARFNLSQPKPVAWTCEDAQCSAGLGDQWRGIASAFYQVRHLPSPNTSSFFCFPQLNEVSAP